MTAVVTRAPRQASGADRPRLAVAVWAVAGIVVFALLIVAGRYGFHGDEFYFVVTGRHLQIAAPDNPMLVPYLAAGWYGLVDGHLWAFGSIKSGRSWRACRRHSAPTRSC
jgi:hypothetical protein